MPKKFLDRDVARCHLINDMRVLAVRRNESTGEAEYEPANEMGEGIYPDYPILIQGNGLPWTLGNMYLLKRLEFSARYEPKTWRNVAGDLLHYLRWLEKSDPKISPLQFNAKQKFNRPTYRYRAHLIELVNQGSIKPNTASGRMSSIVAFYRGLVDYGVLSNELIDLAWQEREVLLRVIGKDLTPRNYTIYSTDLAIKKPPKVYDDDYISDGGKLRPLSQSEQDILIEHLKASSATYRLMFAMAILTGARMQTICTLRAKTLNDAIFDGTNNRYLLHVGGPGHLVDTKNSKPTTVIVPTQLYELLLHYWDSSQSVSKRLRSYYGDTPTNYLFLNSNGQPYITSKNEKIDRRDKKINPRVSIDGGISADVNTRTGQAIWSFINITLLPRIAKTHPNFKSFTFHDLRATFGMNLLETLLRRVDLLNEDLKKRGQKSRYGTEWVLEQVQERMGHSDIETTMRYLNFRRNQEFKSNLQMKVEDELMKNVPVEVLQYDD
ncbi:tyrosine-type recombinase/integrase [Comamonas thiooxydans]|uniref:tyrosine-type recombinase/integrase n=1 Tax=Comamonas thiooxydans TaxID=363952 RepID=UPI0015A74B13|nr:site-specific integrase [Comamonas thiooxydans]